MLNKLFNKWKLLGLYSSVLWVSDTNTTFYLLVLSVVPYSVKTQNKICPILPIYVTYVSKGTMNAYYVTNVSKGQWTLTMLPMSLKGQWTLTNIIVIYTRRRTWGFGMESPKDIIFVGCINHHIQPIGQKGSKSINLPSWVVLCDWIEYNTIYGKKT